MTDQKVGYKNPPRHTRFKPGVCPNPNGRGRRKDPTIDEMFRAYRESDVAYIEKGKLKKASRAKLSIKRLVRSALNGNLRDAAQLLKLRKQARLPDDEELVITIRGGLPEDPGAPPCVRRLGVTDDR